jgi:hypothetical protein
MKTKLKKTAIALSLMFAVMALPTLASAHNHDGDNDRDDHCQKPPSAPIDGGLSLLLVAGVGYGLKKAKERRKNSI